MSDVLGEAISDYYHQTSTGKLWVHNKYGPKEEMPVDVYFRDAEDMPEMEWQALQQCKGKILDIGAGAGSHALVLQGMGLDITALDISPKAARVMQLRGVNQIIRQDYFTLETGSFDTLLLLMNGIGLAGTLDGLNGFLDQAKKIMNPGASLIFDSSDIAYLYEEKPYKGNGYYGEILYQYEYRKQKSDWFNWLFIDRKTLIEITASAGWHTSVLTEDEWGQYLVKCELR
ncbi:class I SAM-dependent methyltransferase [Flavitalea flava]